ncbi:MAG: YihY/virulence factor BrkB family protein [Chitinophagales bacterium]
MSKFVDAISKFSGWNYLVDLSKRWMFPGHRKISLYEVLAFLFKEMQRDAIMQRAGSVSFALFVSLFPTLLMAFTLIPFLPIAAYQKTIMSTMQQVMPGNVFELLHSTIEDIITRHRADLFSISLVLAIYYSSRGVIGLMNSFDKALPTFRKRTYWRSQVVAFKIMGLLTLLLIFSVTLIIGGELLVQWVMKILHDESSHAYYWLTIIRWVIIIFVYYFSISLIYYYGPAKHERWRFFTAGSTVATILLLLVSLLYTVIINQFGTYNKLYGSIGTLLVTQLWIYYNSLGLLVGFELNASIEVNENKLLATIQ